MTEPTICQVCKADLRTQPHELGPHREAAGLNRRVEDEPYRNLNIETRNRLIENSMRNHPAGNRRPTGQHRTGK